MSPELSTSHADHEPPRGSGDDQGQSDKGQSDKGQAGQSQPAQGQTAQSPAQSQDSAASATPKDADASPVDDPLFISPEEGQRERFADEAKPRSEEDSQFDLSRLSGSFLEQFNFIDRPKDFGALVDTIHTDLEEHRLLFLQSPDGERLTDFARALIARHFVNQRSYACYASPNWRRKAPKSFEEIADQVVEASGRTLVVVFDPPTRQSSLLTDYYQYARGGELKHYIKAKSAVRMLVMTNPDRFSAFVSQSHAHELKPLGRALPGSDAANVDKTAAAPELLASLETAHGQAGVLSAWAIVWLNEASVDGLITMLDAMLTHAWSDAKDRQDRLAAWRKDWPAILRHLRVAGADDEFVGIRLRPASESHLDDLQTQFRLGDRMRHVEALTLLRNSGALLEADVDVLAAFAWTMARLATIEPRPGPFVLAVLTDEWLPRASRQRLRFVLVAVFISLVHTGNAELAQSALVALCQADHPDHAAAVLTQCPPSFVSESWQLAAYNKVLPHVSELDRLRVWSRLVKVAAAPEGDLGAIVALLHEQVSTRLFAEFVGRYVEEALLGSRKRRRRLLELLLRPAEHERTAGDRLVEMLRSEVFRDYAQRRADKWTRIGHTHPLFDTWIVRTLTPIVPAVPEHRLFGLFGHALHDAIPEIMPRRFRKHSPADAIMALLLVDGCSPFEESDAPFDDENVEAVVTRLVGDPETATAVFQTLRVVSDRLIRACRVSVGVGDVLHRDAWLEVRRFFTARSAVVKQVRDQIQRRFFTGGERADPATE